MRLKSIALCFLCLLAPVLSIATELSDKLASPDYVLLMRHTLAPGVGDPAHYTLDDCKTQRNLSAEGRKQATAVGRWLKKQGIQAAEVHASAWCRCKDTAELLKMEGYKVEPALASFFDDMQQAPARNQALQRFISAKRQSKGNKALILVTHHVNIQEFSGENVASGDMVLAQVDASGKLVNYKVIPRPD
jgi:phosphohistidine phosphatase SixA